MPNHFMVDWHVDYIKQPAFLLLFFKLLERSDVCETQDVAILVIESKIWML